MLGLDISLIHLAGVLWSGMLIISGSIWVLGSQVGRVAEAIERKGVGAASAAAGRPQVCGRPTPVRSAGRREWHRRRPMLAGARR